MALRKLSVLSAFGALQPVVRLRPTKLNLYRDRETGCRSLTTQNLLRHAPLRLTARGLCEQDREES